MVAPLDPCSFRFSAPLVEKMLKKRSKSSTVVVARINSASSAEVSSRSRDIARAVSRVGRGTGPLVLATRNRRNKAARLRETSSAARPGGFEGFVPISEGLLSHHPPIFDREEEGELVSIHGNLAHRSHPVDLGYRDHLVSGVDQLDGVDRVPGQSLFG